MAQTFSLPSASCCSTPSRSCRILWALSGSGRRCLASGVRPHCCSMSLWMSCKHQVPPSMPTLCAVHLELLARPAYLSSLGHALHDLSAGTCFARRPPNPFRVLSSSCPARSVHRVPHDGRVAVPVPGREQALGAARVCGHLRGLLGLLWHCHAAVPHARLALPAPARAQARLMRVLHTYLPPVGMQHFRSPNGVMFGAAACTLECLQRTVTDMKLQSPGVLEQRACYNVCIRPGRGACRLAHFAGAMVAAFAGWDVAAASYVYAAL